MSYHGCAPEERGLKTWQCPLVRHRPTTISAAWRAHAANLNVTRMPPAQRHRAPELVWRTLLAVLVAVGDGSWHVATRARRKREAFRRKSALLYTIERLQLAWHGARNKKPLVLRLPPETASAGVPAPRETRGACWRWRRQLARRTTGARRRREASYPTSIFLYAIRRPHPAGAARRTHAESLIAAPTPRRQGAPARLRLARHAALVGVGGRSWHVTPRARAEIDRPLAEAVAFRTPLAK